MKTKNIANAGGEVYTYYLHTLYKLQTSGCLARCKAL